MTTNKLSFSSSGGTTKRRRRNNRRPGLPVNGGTRIRMVTLIYKDGSADAFQYDLKKGNRKWSSEEAINIGSLV